MNTRLQLFRQAAKLVRKPSQPARKLYTDQIYPYPFEYINTKKWPEIMRYRETFGEAPWSRFNRLTTYWGMRIFWTYWWFMLFTHPEVITGHFHPPDPSLWTDAELGIPPDDAGKYEDWLKENRDSEQ